jgi:hypothetical protein
MRAICSGVITGKAFSPRGATDSVRTALMKASYTLRQSALTSGTFTRSCDRNHTCISLRQMASETSRSFVPSSPVLPPVGPWSAFPRARSRAREAAARSALELLRVLSAHAESSLSPRYRATRQAATGATRSRSPDSQPEKVSFRQGLSRSRWSAVALEADQLTRVRHLFALACRDH